MAVFTYTGGVVSMATGSYGGISVRKGSQVTASNSITNSARSFIEGTPTTTLFEPIDRTQQFTRIAHGSGYNSTRFNFNTTEPYNSGAYSTSEYISASNIVFDGQVSTGITSSSSYNTQTNSGEYWSHAYGYVNSEFGTALTVDNDRNVWVVGSTDYCSCTVDSTTASLTSTASFTNSTTTMSSGTNDNGYWFLSTPPWSHNIFGQDSQYFVVHTNSWIAFNAVVNTTQTTFSGISPAVANIQIGAGEASCQRIYWGTFGTAPNRTYRIRFEGTNAITGTLGSPNMVWEAIFYESNKNIFDIQIGAWTPPTTNANGISDGTTYFGTFTPTANTGWRFTTGNATAGASGNNITLVKYSPKGIYQKDNDFNPYTGSDALAVMSIGRNGSDVGEAIKIGSDGRIYILYTSNSLGYVSGVVNNELGVIKIDPKYLYSANGASLSTVWNKTFGTTAADSAQSFDIDLNDNLYITGFTGGSGQGGNDVIAIKVDKTGKVIWKKTYGASTAGDLGNAIRISPDGNSLYIWGYSGSTPLVGTSSDWFLLKVDSSTGSIIWQKHFNIGATTQGQAFENSVDVDEFGNVYVCGFAASSPQAYFVAKLDLNGNFIWHRSVGATTGFADAGTSIRYKNGYLYVGGQDTSTIPNPPNESYGLGVTKINPLTGQVVSNYVIGGTGTEYTLGIEVDNYGDIYATGVTNTTSLSGLGSASGVNALVSKFILDTPLGGFTLSGSAAVWNSRKNVFRYTSGKEYFSAESIVFQNHPTSDLFATGAQAVFYANEATYKLEKEFVFAGTGSLFITDNNVNTKTTFDSPETAPSTQLFTISNGNSGRVFVPKLSGAGDTTISNIVSPSKVSTRYTTNYPYYNSYQIVFEDGVNFRTSEFGYTSGATTKLESEFTFAATNGSITISNGYSNLKFIEQADESTQLFGVTGQHGTRVFVPNWRGQTGSSADGFIGQKPPFTSTKYIPSITGTPPAEYITPTQLVFGNEENIRTVSDGTANYRFQKAAFGGTGQIIQDSSAGKSFAKVEVILTAPILFYYTTNIITKLAMRYAGKNPTTPFGGLDIVFEELEPNAPPREFSLSGGSTIPNSLFKLSGSGQATIGGTVYFTNTKDFDITGNLTAGLESQSEVTFKPAITAPSLQLFSITGQHGTRVFVPNWITSGKLYSDGVTSAATNIKFTSDWVGSSPIQYYDPYQVVFGEDENFGASEFKYYQYIATNYEFKTPPLQGSGTLFVTSGSAQVESFSVNPPDNTTLFTIGSGYTSVKFLPNPPDNITLFTITGGASPPVSKFYYSGSPTTEYQNAYQIIFGDEENLAGEYKGYSTAGYKLVSKESGSGSFSVLSGAAETVGINPPDNTTLFTIAGGYTNLQFIEQADETTQLFNVTGAATNIKFTSAWVGYSPTEYFNANQIVFEDGENFGATEYKYSSTANYRSQAAPIQVSGTLFDSVSGFSEVFGVNPPDITTLFVITGTHGTRVFVPNWIPTGGVVIQPTSAAISFKTSWIGSSPIEYFTPRQVVFEDGENFGASEFKYYQYITTNYEFKTPPLQGSGTLFFTSGTAQVESFSVNPPDNTTLFTIAGGYTDLKFLPNPPDNTTLFDITGSAYRIIANEVNGVNFILAYAGSPATEYQNAYQIVFGDEENTSSQTTGYSTAAYEFTSDYNGAIDVSVISGSAQVESFSVNPPDNTTLFTIGSGYTSVKFLPNPPDNTTLFDITGAATNIKFTSAWFGSSPNNTTITAYQIVFGDEENAGGEYNTQRTALYAFVSDYSGLAEYDITGQGAVEYVAGPWQGQGTITIGGGYTNLQFIEQADETEQLFNVTGAATNIKFTSAWVGSSPVQYYDPYEIIIGEGDIFFASEFKYTSTASYRNQQAPYQGSGTLFTQISGASEVIGVNPPDNTTLFAITGTHGTRVFVPNWIVTGGANISGSGSESQTTGNYTGNSPSEYYTSYQIVFGEDENYGSSDLTTANKFRTISSFTPTTQIGGGTLFTDVFYSNLDVVFRPVDATDTEQLFSISGTHGTKVFVPNWNVSGGVTISNSASASETFDWVGSFSIEYYDPYEIVFEEGDNFYTTEYRLQGTASYRLQSASIVSTGSIASDISSQSKVSFRPFDATDSDPLFSISGSAGVKLKDYVWVSPVVEYDPYEYIINDEFIIPDFIKIKTNFTWDNTNNIYRADSTDRITKAFAGDTSIVINGTHGTRVFVPNWPSSGEATITGNATEKQTDTVSVSGSLTAGIVGAAESFGANPPDITTLFNITGTATEKDINIASGSGSISTNVTVVESYTKVTPQGTGNINILEGGTITAQLFRYNGETANLVTFSGSAVVVSFNPPDITTLFVISGTAAESQTDIAPPGSGSITSNGFFSNLKVAFNPPDNTTLFDIAGTYSEFKFTTDESGNGTTTISGNLVERITDSYVGTITVNISGTATESQTDITVPGSGTFVFDGAADDLYIKGAEQFGGTLFVIEGGAERVVFNPPEGNQLFDVSGSYSDIKATKDYDGIGSVTIEGTLGTRVFVPNWISTGGFVGLSGGAEKVTFNPPDNTSLFDIAGTYSNFKFTTDESGSGSFSVLSGAAEAVGVNPPDITTLFAITGAATESQTDITSGSGSIASTGFFSNLKVVFNPSDLTTLFDVTGAATEKHIDVASGSGSITSDGFYSNLRITFNPADLTSLFAINGTATESQTDSISVSGSLTAGIVGAAESFGVNPPDNTTLFDIAGTSSSRYVLGTLTGSGTTTLSGAAIETSAIDESGSGSIASTGFFSNLKVVFNPSDLTTLFSIAGTATEKHIDVASGSGTITVSGTAAESQTDITSGSGSFSVLSGAAEAVGVNPPDNTTLFVISGAATESQTDITSGSGSITTTGFFSNLKVVFNPSDLTTLFDVTGTYSNLKFTADESGSGTITVTGTATESQTDIALPGTGSLFGFGGSAESIGVNPPDNTTLFVASGTYSNLKFTADESGSGTISVTGTAVQKITNDYVGLATLEISTSTTESQTNIALPGTGSLFGFGGSSESTGVNPPDNTTLFVASGTYSNLKAVKDYEGSGDIFAISGSASSVSFNPPDITTLFVIAGTATESQTDIALPGSGSIGTLSGGAERVTFNPPEDTQLFSVAGAYSNFAFVVREIASGNISISGTAIEKHTDVASGSGTTTLSGTATESQTDIALPGSGSLFTASGSAEAFGVNPPEDTALFAVDGAYSEFKAVKSYVGSGEFSALSGAVVVATISEIGTGLFDVGNTAIESTTYKSIDGSGTLFTLSEATESTTVNPPEDTALFGISGNATEKSALLYYGGEMVIIGSGDSIFARALVPQQGSGEIFVEGDSVDKWEKLFRAQGSGSLYGFSGAAETITNVPPRDTYVEGETGVPDREFLFFVHGSSRIKRSITSDNTIVINTSGTGVIGTALPERVFVTII